MSDELEKLMRHAVEMYEQALALDAQHSARITEIHAEIATIDAAKLT